MFKDYANCVFLSAVKEIREISYLVVILKFYDNHQPNKTINIIFKEINK